MTWRRFEAVNLEAPFLLCGAASYLVSEEASAVAGQALRVDGGLVTL